MKKSSGIFGFFAADTKKHSVEGDYVDQEQGDHANRVQNGTASQQIVENVVGRSVACFEEHIVGAQRHVSGKGRNAEATENGKGDPDVSFLHAGQTRQANIEGSKGRDAVRQARGHVVQGKDGVGVVVLSCADCAEDTAQHAEDQHEIQCSLLQSSFGKGGEGNGNELDTAQEQRKKIVPCGGGVVAPIDHDNDLEDLHGIHQNGRTNEGELLFARIGTLVAKAQKDGQSEGEQHETGGKDEMLGREIPFGLAGISADAEKFFHGKLQAPFER